MSKADEIKEKFDRVQKISQELRDKRTRCQVELESLKKDYNEKVAELLERTGTENVNDAIKYCNEKKAELQKEAEEIEKKLDAYLNS